MNVKVKSFYAGERKLLSDAVCWAKKRADLEAE
jgi:hypothetical protein